MTSTLVVGGGISGTAAAIALARIGFDVTLAEREPEWSALGSGITMIGPALRALDRGPPRCRPRGGCGRRRSSSMQTVRSSRKCAAQAAWPRPAEPSRNDASDAPSRTRGSSRRSWCCRRGRDRGSTFDPSATGSSSALSVETTRSTTWSSAPTGSIHRCAPPRSVITSPPIRGSASRAVLPRHPDVTWAAMVGNPREGRLYAHRVRLDVHVLQHAEPERGASRRRTGPSDPRSECRLRGIVAEVRAQIRDPALTDSRPTPWAIVGALACGRIVLVGDAAHDTPLSQRAQRSPSRTQSSSPKSQRAGEMATGLNAYSARRFEAAGTSSRCP